MSRPTLPQCNAFCFFEETFNSSHYNFYYKILVRFPLCLLKSMSIKEGPMPMYRQVFKYFMMLNFE